MLSKAFNNASNKTFKRNIFGLILTFHMNSRKKIENKKSLF